MNSPDQKKEKKKGFWTRFLEKLDGKLEEKSKKAGCGCQPQDKGRGSCCG